MQQSNTNNNLITALYCRLSQEDMRSGESLSIGNQRLMLTSALIAWDTASIMLVVIAAAFVTFYFITRCINQYKKEPEYPTYFDKTLSDIK